MVILMVVVIMFVVTMFVVIMFVVITCTSQHCRVSWNTESFAPIEQYRLLYRKAPVIVESFMKWVKTPDLNHSSTKIALKVQKGSNFDARPTETLGTATLGPALLSRDLSTQGTVNKRIIITVKLHQHQHHDCIQAARFSQQSFFHIGQVLRKHLFRNFFQKNRQKIFLKICNSQCCSLQLGGGGRVSTAATSQEQLWLGKGAPPQIFQLLLFIGVSNFSTNDISNFSTIFSTFGPMILKKYQPMIIKCTATQVSHQFNFQTNTVQSTPVEEVNTE